MIEPSLLSWESHYVPALDEVTPPEVVRYRFAARDDADAIAALHADSWRRHYRGAYPDDYLDHEAAEDRGTLWRERFRVAAEDQFTVVAELDDGLAGFAHTCLDADPKWGALLDNLHVRYNLQRQGVGRALMAQTGAALLKRRPESPLYLWVLQKNVAAQAFYSAVGGVVVEEDLAKQIPGGATAPVYRVAWHDPRLLVRSPA
jgi:GNAT superfamily N-acetyltransferase